ncbi:hypothetical protein A3Q56_02456 [Intoshia linei]|uniref:Neuropathy target esterase sws n=1 Tax=Intoshia linei TaxID=1819745 RepID=A0A177B672_9BILA|nr:hypothetical protein A3Q56_02456 [Intoshia linei]
MFTLLISFVTIFLSIYYFAEIKFSILSFINRYRKNKTKKTVHRKSLSFRKRDKFTYFRNRIFHTLKDVAAIDESDISDDDESGWRSHRRMLMRKISIKFQRTRCLKKFNNPLDVQSKDLLDLGTSYKCVSSKNVYTYLRNVKLFSCFDSMYIGHFASNVEIKHLNSKVLVDLLDQEYFYIVQSGSIELLIEDDNKQNCILRVAQQGETILSYLRILHYLYYGKQTYKPLKIRAREDTEVICVKLSSFDVLKNNPEDFVRMVQFILVHVQRTAFYVLTHHFGLSGHILYDCDNHRNAQENLTLFKNRKISKRNSLDLYESDSDYYHVDSFDRCIKQGLLSVPSASNLTNDNHCTTEIPLYVVEKMFNAMRMESYTQRFKHLVYGKTYKTGNVIVTKGVICTELHFIVSGSIEVCFESFDSNVISPKIPQNYLINILSIISSEPSLFTLKCDSDCELATINKKSFYKMIIQNPNLFVNLSNMAMGNFQPIIWQMDYAFDLKFIHSGKSIYQQSQKSEMIYSIISGKVRCILCGNNSNSIILPSDIEKNSRRIIGEFKHGDILGLPEYLLNTHHKNTCVAVRDTELAVMSGHTLNYIRSAYNVSLDRIAYLLGQQVVMKSSHVRLNEDLTIPKIHTVALLPMAKNVPITGLALELQHSLLNYGSTLRLSREVIKFRLGLSILEETSQHRLSAWLAHQEENSRTVIYECNYTSDSRWNRICLRQADIVLFVVNNLQDSISLTEMDLFFKNENIRALKHLVILYKPNSLKPSRTGQWLESRPWCTNFHHIRVPQRVYKLKSKKMLYLYKDIHTETANVKSDCSRLARFITGNSIGLVLGGGGARGAAHLGIIKILEENDIPIDMVGGVSIGSLIGATYCMESNRSLMYLLLQEWFLVGSKLWYKIIDLTYPIVSLFTGHVFNWSLRKIFHSKRIEDLWIPFFCVSTDLTSSKIRIHRQGPLWQYVRASMTLSGYLPPLCDPSDGHMLVDGGYVNILPVDIMRTYGMRKIIAVDVGAEHDTDFTDYGSELSGWWLLFKRLFSGIVGKKVKILGMAEIQTRLTYVCCVQSLCNIKEMPDCLYLRPPIQKFGTLQFSLMDAITDIGYDYAKPLIEHWITHEYQTNDTDRKLSAKPNDFIDIVDVLTKSRQLNHINTFFSEPEEEKMIVHNRPFTEHESDY